MGRAMIIIVAGLLLSIGITQTSLFGGLGSMAKHSSNIAESIQSKNNAHMGAEMAIRDMIDDPEWRDGENASYNMGNGSASVTLEEVHTNVIRLVSEGTYNDHTNTITLLLAEATNSSVPAFVTALGIMLEEQHEFSFNIDGGGNKGGVDGNDYSGSCPAVPGVAVINDKMKDHPDLKSNEDHFSGSPPIGVNDEMNFEEISELIKKLDDGQNATYLSGKVSEMGSQENPGVFIVEDSASLRGNSQGYGILIVKSNGEIEVDDAELEISGTAEFHGLVIFENAFALKGNGNIDIFGSVLVGKTNPNSPKFDIRFNGNSRIMYDCEKQGLAEDAASYAGGQTKFSRVSVYEN